jgi:hypothetical protein
MPLKNSLTSFLPQASGFGYGYEAVRIRVKICHYAYNTVQYCEKSQ